MYMWCGEKREKMKKEELWREGSRFCSQQVPAHRQGVVVYMSQVEIFVITIKMESCLRVNQGINVNSRCRNQ